MAGERILTREAVPGGEMRRQVIALLRSWPLVLFLALVGGLLAFGYNFVATPIYEARVTFFVASPGGTQGANPVQADEFAQRRINSYVGVVQSEKLSQIIAEDLGNGVLPADIRGMLRASSDPDTVLLNVVVRSADVALLSEVARSVAENLDTVIGELDNRGADSRVELRVVSGAEPEPVQVAPRSVLNLALGIFLGGALGIAIALLRTQLDTSLRSSNELARITGYPTLGVLVNDREARRHPVLEPKELGSRRAEQYRQLRTSLRFVHAANPVRVLVVTSAVESEGKSSVAINLAVTFSRAGARTLLIDADLRRPQVGARLKLLDEVGVTSVLVGDADFDSVVQEWGSDGLHVLASGPVPPNPSELLGSAAMRSLLTQARKDYDMVIIDTPPIAPVTDAVVTSLLADGAMMVTRYGKTSRDKVAKAVLSLTSVNARVLGSVLTMASPDVSQGGETYYGDAKR